ncbi:hypothetical protein FQN57_004160 [Myotisia sp. PD_48]|nr:hypothetical protein FQN57_004160 [Myotisia sp. PD_48]
MEEPQVEVIREFHQCLSREWEAHSTEIESIWRSLSRSQRKEVLFASAEPDTLLQHSADRSVSNNTLGMVFMVLPEINVRDITKPNSDYLLEHLKHRATQTLWDQYCNGPNGALGDCAFILESMRVNSFRHMRVYKNCFCVFNERDYGHGYRARNARSYDRSMSDLSKYVHLGYIFPKSTAILILERQMYLMQGFYNIVLAILRRGATLSAKRLKNTQMAAIPPPPEPKPAKLSLEDLLANSLEQKSSHQDYLDVCREEPIFLEQAVKHWFLSRPELVPDERGRVLPQQPEKYTSIAIYEVMHHSVARAALWDYVDQILQLLNVPSNLPHRAVILQEVSNVCHAEYERAKNDLKRHLQLHLGAKHFRRTSNAYDNGMARLTLKTKPEDVELNILLYSMLRLCQKQTNAREAITWMKHLDKYLEQKPNALDALSEPELNAYSNLAAIVKFVQNLVLAFPLPPFSTKKGRIYLSRLTRVEAEVDSLKGEVDLAHFATPIRNLQKPAMARGALKAIDELILHESGTELGYLYLILIQESFSKMKEQLQWHKENSGKPGFEPLPEAPTDEPPTLDSQFIERRERYNNRTELFPPFGINPEVVCIDHDANEAQLPRVFVNKTTFEVFSTLFSSSKNPVGTISWAAFVSAMEEVGFSAKPKWGSVFGFSSIPGRNTRGYFILQRPYQSTLTKHSLLHMMYRVKGTFGWDNNPFGEL